jgi:hypothetical protein
MTQAVAVELDKSLLPTGTRRHIPALDGLRGFQKATKPEEPLKEMKEACLTSFRLLLTV